MAGYDQVPTGYRMAPVRGHSDGVESARRWTAEGPDDLSRQDGRVTEAYLLEVCAIQRLQLLRRAAGVQIPRPDRAVRTGDDGLLTVRTESHRERVVPSQPDVDGHDLVACAGADPPQPNLAVLARRQQLPPVGVQTDRLHHPLVALKNRAR